MLTKKPERTLFTKPSHNQHAVFNKEFENFYRHDLSEIEGFDNLQDPKSAILMAQGKVSDILKTKQTFFVVQGATTALLAAMKALISPGDKVLAARNCHKTVFNGLLLTAGLVDWFMPEVDPNWGIYTHIDPDKLSQTLELNDYKAFILTSPTYEGINSDIETIAQICRNHNTYLIVDEAHGSLYNFAPDLPKTAIEQGADVSINSLHKTAGALNQCALLNVSNTIKNIDIEIFQKALNIFQTTSPSYPLLENIEACINFLNSNQGALELSNLLNEINKLKPELERLGIELYSSENQDPTKILLRKEVISGCELSQTLFYNFNIEDEMNNSISCLYLTGVGTTKQKLDKLKQALKKVPTNPSYKYIPADFQPHPLVKIQPVGTFNREYVYVNRADALLKISNKLIMPYPPGFGVLYPGE
ncbi:aminotransferase class V-fold PLP-dependent enzyme, partial [bacterium]|nr:aminotransferase class V-fold PLP-dependent enzyme [bacterium]